MVNLAQIHNVHREDVLFVSEELCEPLVPIFPLEVCDQRACVYDVRRLGHQRSRPASARFHST